MSTRAYRLVEIKTADDASINLSRQYELAEWLGHYSDDGMYCVERGRILELLKSPKLIEEFKLEKAQLKQLEIDAHSVTEEDDLIEYMAW